VRRYGVRVPFSSARSTRTPQQIERRVLSFAWVFNRVDDEALVAIPGGDNTEARSESLREGSGRSCDGCHGVPPLIVSPPARSPSEVLCVITEMSRVQVWRGPRRGASEDAQWATVPARDGSP
jgi:hypothetical protein